MHCCSLILVLSQAVLDFDPNGGQLIVSKVDSGEGTPQLTFTTDDTNDWLLITLPETLSTSDTFTVRVFYSGYPSSGGVFGAPYRVETHGSGVPVVYTFSEPYGARKWWPCKDVPEDKATIDLHIIAESPYFVVSNGKLLSIEDAGGGYRQFNYSETYPIVTYLVSICCSNYIFGSAVYTSQDGTITMTVGHYVYPENSEELGGIVGTLEAMNLFSQLFAEYPFIREKYVTATHNSGAGMEHQTCTSMPPGDLAPDGRGRRNIHELAHQWFGDSITMAHFDHLWLNEGFATYCEALYVEHYQGMDAYHDYVNAWESRGINDAYPLVNPNADLFYGSLVYRKGTWVLHMLRHIMGDEDFFDALRNYYHKYAYQTALTPHLQAEFEALYGESLDWFFQEWVYGTGRPTYTWSWHTDSTPGDNVLNLTIRQTQSGSIFKMPLDVRVSDLNGREQTFVVWNEQQEQLYQIPVGDFEVFNVEIDPDNWVLNRTGESAAMPTLKSVVASETDNSVIVTWESGGGDTTGFQLIASENLTTWTLIADSDVLDETTRSYIVDNLTPGESYYFRIRAISSSGYTSALNDTYGVRIPLTPAEKKVLIVDGYDRWDSQGGGISHPWAASHGESVDAYGVAFNTCANEAVIDGSINLADYDAVLWVLGEESTADETFATQEQTLVKSYLNGGGNLFVSGAEIGWDPDYRGSSTDRSFYNNYLKASYVRDDSNDYSVEGVPGGIFAGLSFNFDDGSAGIYPVGWPDVINPYGGSMLTLRYNSTDGAAVQFAGLFPEGSSEGRLVYLGFPFETIYPASERDFVMERVLDFLLQGISPTPTPSPTATPSPTPPPTPTPIPGFPTVYEFIYSTEGWTTDAATGIFDVPDFSFKNGALNINTHNNTNTFGFWRNELDAIPVEGPEYLYRIEWQIYSDQSDPSLVPIIRVRATAQSYQQTDALVISSVNGGFFFTDNTALVYDVFYSTRKCYWCLRRTG